MQMHNSYAETDTRIDIFGISDKAAISLQKMWKMNSLLNNVNIYMSVLKTFQVSSVLQQIVARQ